MASASISLVVDSDSDSDASSSRMARRMTKRIREAVDWEGVEQRIMRQVERCASDYMSREASLKAQLAAAQAEAREYEAREQALVASAQRSKMQADRAHNALALLKMRYDVNNVKNLDCEDLQTTMLEVLQLAKAIGEEQSRRAAADRARPAMLPCLVCKTAAVERLCSACKHGFCAACMRRPCPHCRSRAEPQSLDRLWQRGQDA